MCVSRRSRRCNRMTPREYSVEWLHSAENVFSTVSSAASALHPKKSGSEHFRSSSCSSSYFWGSLNFTTSGSVEAQLASRSCSLSSALAVLFHSLVSSSLPLDCKLYLTLLLYTVSGSLLFSSSPLHFTLLCKCVYVMYASGLFKFNGQKEEAQCSWAHIWGSESPTRP